MAEPIRIELADRESATSLVQELFGRFGGELVHTEDAWIVEVPAPEHAPTRHVRSVLGAVERWLRLYGVDEVTVHLDGVAHPLTRAATRRSESAAPSPQTE